MMPSAAAVLMTFSLVILPSSELRNTEASFFSCGRSLAFLTLLLSPVFFVIFFLAIASSS